MWNIVADDISPLHSLTLVPVEMTEWVEHNRATCLGIAHTCCHFERSREIQAIIFEKKNHLIHRNAVKNPEFRSRGLFPWRERLEK